MFACCQYSEVRYIEMDKSVHKSFLIKNFGPDAVTVYRKEPNPFSSVRKQLPEQEVLYVIEGNKETKLCNCECHLNDPNLCVMH